ncbi:hypothetical protein EJ02DRAFT_48437 [Clathrospora elynae]|uniref:WKF domain-containing protein n=1 Tax=Clathrospora elynae TaxID=706981 RepID=A0A6A5SCI9_9PLEO|nr:hypothetical protein EJ02DRAFT_48437 [Clathrospora elynae]
MAQDGSRLPAWRRLGLALKNEDQSGVAVPESQTSHREPQRVAAYDTQEPSHGHLQSPIELAVNGNSPSLGKRKHQQELAEEHGQHAKKSRIVPTEGETNGFAAHEAPIIPEAASVKVETVIEVPAPATGTAQPKGDSNYRKKKEKPKKRRREDQDAKVNDTKRQAQLARGSALSPDQFVPASGRATLLASTESNHTDVAPIATPQKHPKRPSHKDSASSPPTDRRRFVAFTPDTKTSDGNTGQDLFKQWVAEQKGTGAVSAPPEVSNFTLHSLIAEEEKAARKNGQLEKKEAIDNESSKSDSKEREEPRAAKPVPETQKATPKPSKTKSTPAISTASNTAKGKKKDPSIYIAYLTQYYTDRDNWKFNKAKQNDLVDNALSVFRIPDEHSEALVEYVSGLKGAGVIDRLQERCNATLKELDEQDIQNPMTDEEARKAAQEEAEQERIAKERNRRNVEGDVADLASHTHGDGYIRRLRRKRAEALLNALGRAAPILPAHPPRDSSNPMMKNIAPPERDSRKRKRRLDISSDESSSDSSSDDDSSDSDSDSDSESGNDSSSKSGTGKGLSLRSASSSESESSSSDNDSDADSE